MEGLVAVGLASNVIGYIATATKVYGMIKEYSSLKGAPAEIIAISKRMDMVLQIVRNLDEAGKARLDHEKATLKMCSEEADKLRVFLESLKISPESEGSGQKRLKWLGSRSGSLEKAWKAMKTVQAKGKLDAFQTSLSRILELVSIQQQSRVENTASRVEDNTEILIHSSNIMTHQQSRIENTTSRVDYKTGTLIGHSELILESLKELRITAETGSANVSYMQGVTIFMVPLSRNFSFVGREVILSQVRQNLEKKKRDPSHVSKTALCGIGGVGKSQISLEYAYQLLETSPETSIFWVHASSQARFEESYKRIAAEFEIPGLDVLQPVRNWLELRYKKPWLMIVDNVDDTLVFAKTSSGRSLLEYIPRAGNGSVLYTSRSRDVCFNLVDDPVMVSPMSNVEAKALLANGNLNTGADDECDQLIEELDCLPLAITQANSYVANRGNTISQYLQLYQRDELLKNMLLGHEFSHARREGRIHGSAAATLLISFQHIKLESPKAIELLFLMSLLDRQDIPQEFLTSDDISVVDFEEAIGILKSYSLITEGSAENCFSMHQMVQEVARVTLTDEPENAFRQFAFRAVQVLASKFPDGEFATWKTCARYLPHAEAVLRRGVEGKPTEYLLEFTRLLSNVAFYTSKHKFPEAIEQAEESLRILQLAGQRSSPQLLQAKQKLAYIVYDQGDDDDRSVQLHREVFEAKEALLGPDHLDTLLAAEALSMALLASYDRGDDKESEELARRALAGKKRVMSDNDPKVLTSLLNVGLCLREQSKDSEAEAFLQQATVLNQQVHGEMHPETATALVNLGHLYRENERYEEALQYIHRATRIAERVYGAEHYETIIMQLHVSTVLNKSKKSEEAEPILRKWLPLIKRIWNHNHFWTLLCLRELHIALCKQSKLEEAESLVREEILERQQLIDSCSPKILPFMDQVAEIMYYAGKDDEAQAWRTKALAGWQRHYGDQDARTAHAMFELASGFFGLQQYDDSKAYFRKLISIRRSVLGSNHHSTLLAYFWLGKVLRKQKKFIESAACYRDVLAGWEIIHGYKHHFTLEAAEGLAFVLLDLKELKEAETLFQRVLTSRMETLGENDPLTFDSMEDLYSMYYKGDKFRESEELCRQMLKIQVRRSGENDHKTLRIKSNLLAALQKQKKPEADAILLDIESRCVKLGLLSFNEKKYADAAEYYERAFYLRAVKYGRGDLRTLTLRRKIGAVFTLQGDYEQAEEVYREVLDDIEQEDEPMDELKAEVCASLADLLDTLCRGDEAMRLRRSLRPAALGRKK